MTIFEIIDIGYATNDAPKWVQWMAFKIGRRQVVDLGHSRAVVRTFMGEKYLQEYLKQDQSNAVR